MSPMHISYPGATAPIPYLPAYEIPASDEMQTAQQLAETMLRISKQVAAKEGGA